VFKRGYKFRFYPTAEQATLLRKTLGCARFVWNYFLDLRQKSWTQENKSLSYYDTAKLLTQLKKEPEYSWLSEVSIIPLRYSIYELDGTYKKFFKGNCGYPNFKKKTNRNSIGLDASAFSIKNDKFFIAKNKQPLNIKFHRQLSQNQEIKYIHITLEPSGKWYVSFNLDDHSIQPLTSTDKMVGIDLGITTFATTSDGDKIKSPVLKEEYQKLKKLQRKHSKKQKGSNNCYKARLKVAKQHDRITSIRKNFHHQVSRKLVNENQVIVLEDLKIKNMLKNRKLSRAISEQGWYQFKMFLDYKCNWYGRELTIINQWYPSSKTCSSCGSIQSKMPLSVREWTCPDCGSVHDRDINAAKNILAVGTTVSACGDSARPKVHKELEATSVKQETAKLDFAAVHELSQDDSETALDGL
jgi:putative transposase